MATPLPPSIASPPPVPAAPAPSKPAKCDHVSRNTVVAHTIGKGEFAGQEVCSPCFVKIANYQVAIGDPF